MLEGQLGCLSFTNTRLPSNDRRTTQTLPVDFHLRDFEQTHGMAWTKHMAQVKDRWFSHKQPFDVIMMEIRLQQCSDNFIYSYTVHHRSEFSSFHVEWNSYIKFRILNNIINGDSSNDVFVF